MKGNSISVGYIDITIVIIPFNLCKPIKWKLVIYVADWYHIKNVMIIIEINTSMQMKIYVITTKLHKHF